MSTNRTIQKVVLAILSSMAIITYTWGQTIDKQHNLPRINDELQQKKLSAIIEFQEGKGQVWDLSNADETGDKRKILIAENGISDSLSISDMTSSMYFHLNGDTIYYSGIENNQSRIMYHNPIAMLSFPFRYGDSYQQAYSGNGVYCSKWKTQSTGTCTVKADASGTLTTPDRDIMNGVVRIHISRRSVNSICKDTLSKKPDTILQEDDYLWFAPGYRYPILHATSLSSRDATSSSVWYTPPYIQEELALDDDNLFVRNAVGHGAYGNDALEGSMSDKLHYMLNTSNSGKRVKVMYDQSIDGEVSFIIASIGGMVYESHSEYHEAGSGYVTEFNLNRLRKGGYVMYICLDGERNAEKFNIK